MTKRLAAVALACGLFAAGCGGNDKSSSMNTATAASDHHMAATTDSGASELRAGLTAQLQEHVYLAGIAAESAGAVSAAGARRRPPPALTTRRPVVWPAVSPTAIAASRAILSSTALLYGRISPL